MRLDLSVNAREGRWRLLLADEIHEGSCETVEGGEAAARARVELLHEVASHNGAAMLVEVLTGLDAGTLPRITPDVTTTGDNGAQ